ERRAGKLRLIIAAASCLSMAEPHHLSYRGDPRCPFLDHGDLMSGALDGLVALDLATFVAAPFCCTLLGEMGAEVIKVEQPGPGDDLRRLGHNAAGGVSQH